MSGGRPPLSVVIPVLNEEESLGELYARLSRILPVDAELVFVDDGSSDGSLQLLRDLARDDRRVQWVSFRRNFGKSLALAAGFRRARGKVVAMMDADLQEDPGDISRLADKLAEGFDVASGWRRRRRDSVVKVLGSRLFNWLVGILGGIHFHDINCGLKVMRRDVLEDINLAGGFHRFIPLLAHWRGFRTVEVEVHHEPRRHGRSRYRGERPLRGLLDLVVILFLLRYEARPGRHFVALGSVLGGCGLGISAYLAWLRLATGSIQSRFPLLALGLVLLVVGLQVFSLGLFGELLAYHFRSSRALQPASRASGGNEDTEAAERERATGGDSQGGAYRAEISPLRDGEGEPGGEESP